MRTEYAFGRSYDVEEPGDQPANTDPYIQLLWSKDGLALVDLLHQKDREIESWKRNNDWAMALYEERNLAYWELMKKVMEG